MISSERLPILHSIFLCKQHASRISEAAGGRVGAGGAYQLSAAGGAGVLEAGEADDDGDARRDPQQHPDPEPHPAPSLSLSLSLSLRPPPPETSPLTLRPPSASRRTRASGGQAALSRPSLETARAEQRSSRAVGGQAMPARDTAARPDYKWRFRWSSTTSLKMNRGAEMRRQTSERKL